MLTAEEQIAAALERGDTAAVHYWESVIRVADSAPEFTPTLVAQLSVLCRPALPATMPPRPQKRRTAPAQDAAAVSHQ